MNKYIWGPTFDEMLNPKKIREETILTARKAFKNDPLNEVNLFNINWYDQKGNLCYFVLPKEITGVKPNIVVMFGNSFPTGSHKVGATYSVTMEKQLNDEINPGVDTIVFPSTGNYGIGGAWSGPRMGYNTKVILPELMSQERFEKIKYYGAECIKTPGCESSVKEIYDKCWDLKSKYQNHKILNQFEVMGNYKFHYYVTGNSMNKALQDMKKKGLGNGRCSALVSAMGSAGSIASGDRLKELYHECKIIGIEPIQCSTIYNNGYGDHDIQGIGDKHVTWIHNVMNMDAIMCIDDIECKKLLQVFTSDIGKDFLQSQKGLDSIVVNTISNIFGISGVCNLLGAIKTARYFDMTEEDTIMTLCTDSIDRYLSVISKLTKKYGILTSYEAQHRFEDILNVKLDFIEEATHKTRTRWHNLKYYTWIEQQQKSLDELNAQKHQNYWRAIRSDISSNDEKLRTLRGF